MSSQTHPGHGLSISQLLFALNEELRRVAYSPSCVTRDHQGFGGHHADIPSSFSLDKVSQFDRDASATLATIREWKNSLVPVNRIPVDILSLVPTHLNRQGDRFRASFVCRHWRRTFVQYGELWTQLFLSKGEAYTKTLLSRAKGSALDIIVGSVGSASTLTLLSSRCKRIRSLNLTRTSCIEGFSQAAPGPYPLLRTLVIDAVDDPDHSESPLLPPPLAFPNLVSFDFQATVPDLFIVSQLLDFLESSPRLEAVRLKIIGEPFIENIPQERVVILPNVERFNLTVSDGGPSYPIAAHISCPSASLTSIKHETHYNHYTIEEDTFPPLIPWNAIVHQYSKSLIEEVAFELEASQVIECRLAFRSLDGAVIELCSNITIDVEDPDEDEDGTPHEWVYKQLFTEATGTIRNHPELANIKRLRLSHGSFFTGSMEAPHIEQEVARLFKTMGPLEELVLSRDPRLFLDPFFPGASAHISEELVFPQIKDLTITYPVTLFGPKWEGALVGLAKSQHARGVPFGRVIIHSDKVLEGMEKKLSPWVGSVNFDSKLQGWDF